MRILFFTHHFFPEGNAPATRVYEMTRRWARKGYEVTVVAGVPKVPGVQGLAAELVKEAEAGPCIEPENEVAVVEAATKLAQDRPLAQALGAAGFERITRRHDCEALGRDYLAEVEGLLAAGASP